MGRDPRVAACGRRDASLRVRRRQVGTVESVNDGVLDDRRPRMAARLPARRRLRSPRDTDRYQVDYTSSMGTFSRWMNGYGSRRKEPAQHHLLRRAHGRGSQGPHLDLARSDRADDDRRLPRRPSGDELDAHRTATSSSTSRRWTRTAPPTTSAKARLRASHRKTDPPAWHNFGLPFHRSTAGRPAAAHARTSRPTLDFDLEGTAISIDAGHRIRITLAGADRANYELWPDHKGKDRPTITVHRGGEQASYVELPVVERRDHVTLQFRSKASQIEERRR